MDNILNVSDGGCPTPAYPQDFPTQKEPFQSDFTQYKPGIKTVYKTPKQSMRCIVCTIGLITMAIFYGTFTFILIRLKENDAIYALVFITIWGAGFLSIGGLGIFYTSITIDPTFGTFSIKKKKLCCCFSETKEYKIYELRKVIIQREYKMNSESQNQYKVFKMEILLQNNLIITALSGLYDENNESKKVLNILRNSLPNNIEIEYIDV